MKPHRQFEVLQAHALLHIQNGTRLLERTFKPIEFLAYTSALLAVEEEIYCLTRLYTCAKIKTDRGS